MSKMKVVLYCRSATFQQLAYQKEQLIRYAEENDCEVVAIVTEKRNGVSARRWKLNLAMRLAQKYSAAILIRDISRMSRVTAVVIRILERLQQRRIKLYTTIEGMEKDAVEMNLLHSVLADMVNLPNMSMV